MTDCAPLNSHTVARFTRLLWVSSTSTRPNKPSLISAVCRRENGNKRTVLSICSKCNYPPDLSLAHVSSAYSSRTANLHVVRLLTSLGTFTEPSTEYLFLSNSSDEPLAFKVKTTAPKLYCVRPNASIVPPGESVKISLILQGFTQPLAKDYKCKDKFLIVSLPCPGLDDASKVSESWPQLESKYKEQLLQKKLKVNFVVTSDDDDKDESQINDTSYANATQSAPLTAPLAAAGTAAAAAAGTAAAALGLNSGESTDKSNINTSEAPLQANGSARDGGISGASGSSEKRTAQEDVDKELEQSNARISTLSEKLDSNETSATPVSSTDEAVSGISMPFAVLLVLIALLLGWYIF